MNVEWWGGEQSSPPADCNSALPAAKLRCLVGLICPKVERWRAHCLYGGRDARAPRAPSLSVFICVHLWLSNA